MRAAREATTVKICMVVAIRKDGVGDISKANVHLYRFHPIHFKIKPNEEVPGRSFKAELIRKDLVIGA